jgi:hypothetical protein
VKTVTVQIGNFEYGVEITDPSAVARVYEDMLDYVTLGTPIARDALKLYGEVAERVRGTYRELAKAVDDSTRAEFEANLRAAEDELIRLRLGGGPMQSVFVRTIRYLLRKYGPLRTKNLHPLIEEIHPDLCDNSVDRVINGERFGKKWKHAARSAQQELKKRGEIEQVGGPGGPWRLTQ